MLFLCSINRRIFFTWSRSSSRSRSWSRSWLVYPRSRWKSNRPKKSWICPCLSPVESTSAMMKPQGLNLVCLFFYLDVKIIRKLSRRRRGTGTRVQGEEGCIPLQLSWLNGWVHTPPARSPLPPVPFLKDSVMLTCNQPITRWTTCNQPITWWTICNQPIIWWVPALPIQTGTNLTDKKPYLFSIFTPTISMTF